MADLRWQVGLWLIVAAAGVAAGLVLTRWVAGPVFGHELRVLARRGVQPRLRGGLVVVLLGALLLTYVGEFGWDAVAGDTPQTDPRSSRFAERFAVTVLAVQLLAVVVLTPAVVGGAITEERDRGTLDLLRTTQLTDREIVVGKLLARLAVVAGVVAAGLPVLALTLLFGGVDPRRLLAVYAVTAVTGFGLGSASLYLGTVKDSLRSVLAWVYGGVLVLTLAGSCCWQQPGVGGLSPAPLVVTLMVADNPFAQRVPAVAHLWVGYLVFGLVYGGGGLLLTVLATRSVRAVPLRRSDDSAAVRQEMRGFYVRPLGDDADPLVWQEREFGGRRFGGGGFRFACGTAVLFVFGAGLFVGLARAVEDGQWVAGAVARAVRPFLSVAAGVVPLAVGLRLAGAVGRERDRQTLDALLMLPADRRDVLRAKLTAAAQWAWWVVALVFGSLGLAVLVGGVRIGDGVLIGVHLVAAGVFATGLAAWVWVHAATGTRAIVLFLTGQLVIVVVPIVAAPLAALGGESVGHLVRGFSPPAAVWMRDVGVWVLLPATMYAVAGWLMWRAAERRLERGEWGA